MLVPSPSTKELLEMTASNYAEQLEGSEAKQYLIEERKITKEVLDSYKIGFVGEPHRFHTSFAGRISFPYITKTGVVSIKFRRVGDGSSSKFLYLPGDSGRIYNTPALESSTVYICEGELDTLTAVMCGYPAVGIPGATNWKPYFAPAFRYRRVYVVGDADDSGAGYKFAKEVASELDNCQILMCPQGYDLNSLYVKNGIEAVRELFGDD